MQKSKLLRTSGAQVFSSPAGYANLSRFYYDCIILATANKMNENVAN